MLAVESFRNRWKLWKRGEVGWGWISVEERGVEARFDRDGVVGESPMAAAMNGDGNCQI